MKQKQIWILIFISLAHLIICILAGAIGWDWQSVIVSAMSAASMYIVYRKIDKRLLVCALVILPFFLLYIPLSIQSKNILNYPVWICGVIASLLAILLIKFKAKLITYSTVFIVFCILEYLFVYPNFFSYRTMRFPASRYNLSKQHFVDINNNEILPEKLKGKVVLFDVWHSACYSCIKEFPEVQKLYDHYKNDSTVMIVSLNYPLESDKGIKPQRFSEKYTFNKMYFLKEQAYEEMVGDGMPLVFIMDKNSECRYAGYLNTSWNIFIGNAKRIINKLKNE